MASRWTSVTIVLFWMSTMGWLVHEKIIPSLAVGEPPSYRALLDHHGPADRAVGWSIFLAGRPLGWAISTATLDAEGGYQLKTRVRMEEVPLATLAPGWMAPVLKMLQNANLDLNLDARSSIDVDPLGRPVDFDSTANLSYPTHSDRPLPADLRFSTRGTFEGNKLKLEVRSGDFAYKSEMFLQRDALLGDEMSPQARLPRLKVGQSWTVPAYSPFRPPNEPVEILQAKVERFVSIDWHGRPMDTMLVVLRSDPGSGLSNAQSVRGRSWVSLDGSVLRQEVILGNSHLYFVRVEEPAPPIADDQDDLTPWWVEERPEAAPPPKSSSLREIFERWRKSATKP